MEMEASNMGHLTYLELSTTLFLSVVNFSFLSTMTRTLHERDNCLVSYLK